MELIAIFLIISAFIWLLSQFFPSANPWIARISLCVWVALATIMLAGINVD